MRWIWIDKFVEFRSGEFAKAVKNVSAAEDQLRDHLPGYPLMPLSLVIEGMAQTGGILVGETTGFNDLIVLAKLSRVDFHDTAIPGDQLTYEARIVELRDEGAVVNTEAFVNAKPLATAEIVFGRIDRSAGGVADANERYRTFRQDLFEVLGVPQRVWT